MLNIFKKTYKVKSKDEAVLINEGLDILKEAIELKIQHYDNFKDRGKNIIVDQEKLLTDFPEAGKISKEVVILQLRHELKRIETLQLNIVSKFI